MINIEINNLTNTKVDKKFLKRIAEKVLKSTKIKISEISVVIVGEKRMRNLNKKYRKKNKLTDVLTFDYGEIFICLPQARRQAKELGHSLKEELTTLLIHGILHLAGYKDKTRKEKDKMMKKQNWLIASLG